MNENIAIENDVTSDKAENQKKSSMIKDIFWSFPAKVVYNLAWIGGILVVALTGGNSILPVIGLSYILIRLAFAFLGDGYQKSKTRYYLLHILSPLILATTLLFIVVGFPNNILVEREGLPVKEVKDRSIGVYIPYYHSGLSDFSSNFSQQEVYTFTKEGIPIIIIFRVYFESVGIKKIATLYSQYVSGDSSAGENLRIAFLEAIKKEMKSIVSQYNLRYLKTKKITTALRDTFDPTFYGRVWRGNGKKTVFFDKISLNTEDLKS